MTKQGIKEIATGRSDVYRLAPTDLHVKDGWNAREREDPDNVAHVEALAASIAEVGVKQPLRVYWEDGKAFISDGHSRFEAVKLAISNGAEIKSIPVITEDRYSNEADHVFTQIVANSGKPLTPFETGKVFKRLVGFGWSEKDIAAKSGMTRQRVVDLLELQAAPDAVTSLVKSGQVSATLAGSVMKKHKGDGDQAAADLNKAVETAKEQGKARATAKHVGLTFKQEIREIFGRSTAVPGGYLFNAGDMARLQVLIGAR